MEWKTEDFNNPAIAALAGSLLGLKAWPGVTWGERAANLVLGFLTAIIGGPAVIDYFGIVSTRIGAGVIFVCGSAGLVVFAAIIEGVRQTRVSEIIRGWLSRHGTDTPPGEGK